MSKRYIREAEEPKLGLKRYVKSNLLKEEDEAPIVDGTMFIKNMISGLVKDEWEAVDGYNSILASIGSYVDPEDLEVIKDILSEEYTHIGQLEGLLKKIDPAAGGSIEDGENEAEEQMEETPAEEPEADKDDLGSVELPADDIEIEEE